MKILFWVGHTRKNYSVLKILLTSKTVVIRCFMKHRNAFVPQSFLLIHLQAVGLQLYLKRDTIASVLGWTLLNFSKQLFYRLPAKFVPQNSLNIQKFSCRNDCYFWKLVTTVQKLSSSMSSPDFLYFLRTGI